MKCKYSDRCKGERCKIKPEKCERVKVWDLLAKQKLTVDNYRNLSDGETFSKGDEWQSPGSGVWDPIPEQWYGMKVNHDGNNTISRMNIKFRRPK
jgi:hypothetical protein